LAKVRKMPRIKIKDLPTDLKISREEMKKLTGGALLRKATSKSGSIDFGLALIELLAESADALSVQQDAVSNEAYLSTARQRNSNVARKRWRD
jgi:hypothetical protein